MSTFSLSAFVKSNFIASTLSLVDTLINLVYIVSNRSSMLSQAFKIGDFGVSLDWMLQWNYTFLYCEGESEYNYQK